MDLLLVSDSAFLFSFSSIIISSSLSTILLATFLLSLFLADFGDTDSRARFWAVVSVLAFLVDVSFFSGVFSTSLESFDLVSVCLLTFDTDCVKKPLFKNIILFFVSWR